MKFEDIKVGMMVKFTSGPIKGAKGEVKSLDGDGIDEVWLECDFGDDEDMNKVGAFAAEIEPVDNSWSKNMSTKNKVFRVVKGEKYVMALSAIGRDSDGVCPEVEAPCDGIYVSASAGFICSDVELEEMGFVHKSKLGSTKGNGSE